MKFPGGAIRFFIFCLSIFGLLGGLRADDKAVLERVLRPPDTVRFTAPTGDDGVLKFVGLHTLRDGCENLGPYSAVVTKDTILVESYLLVDREGVCIEVFRGEVPREYRVTGLVPGAAYRVFFKSGTGADVDFGWSPARP